MLRLHLPRKRIIAPAFLAACFFVAGVFFVFAQDIRPPEIDGIQIQEVGNDYAVINWSTDDEADSQVNYGLTSQYGVVREPVADKREHSIRLDELEPATTYHFRVLSADEFGNQTVSGDFTLTTEGVVERSELEEVIEEEEQVDLANKALAIIDQITDPDALEKVTKKVEEVADRTLLPPTIIGSPIIEEVGENFAIVTWQTDRRSGSLVQFSSENQYNLNTPNVYASVQGDGGKEVFQHRVEVVGLQPATTYHFRVASEDVLGLVGNSPDATFTTTSPLPLIRNLQIAKVEETSATFSWNTTVPASGFVEFTDLSTGQVRTVGSPELISGHTVRLPDLVLGTQYSAIVYAENAAGDRITSDTLTFVTVKDEEPPIISQVSNESTLYPGADTRIQTIVSWKTDEPSYCQMFFKQGVDPLAEPESFAREEAPLTEHAQVVVSFAPATVYKFWVECEDEAGNPARSEDFVLFTPEKEKSIIDIILENFEGAFGWVKNIG